MAEHTDGIILTNEKDFWVIAMRVGKAIDSLTIDGWKSATQEERSNKTAAFIPPELDMAGAFTPYFNAASGTFCFRFTFNGEQRILSVHTDSDGDVRMEFGQDKTGIILSLNYWGSSVELIEAILSQLQDMGECFIDENDSDAEGYRPIQEVAA